MAKLPENIKKGTYLILLIIFLPLAIYLLITGKFLHFLILAGIVTIIIRILKKV